MTIRSSAFPLLVLCAVSNMLVAQSAWQELSPTGNLPPARVSAGMAYDATRHNAVLFGGIGPVIGLGADTWTWDGTSWTPQGSGPSGRSFPGMAYDEAHQNIVLFSGTNNGIGASIPADTWIWDGKRWTEQFPAASPPAGASSMAFDRNLNKVVLLTMTYGTTDETWTWDGANWTQIATQHAPAVLAEENEELAFDRVNKNLLFWGNGTWTFDGKDWTELTPTAQPNGFVDAFLSWDDDLQQIVEFGGADDNGRLWTDTWIWDGSNKNWSLLVPVSGGPRYGWAGAMAYDSDHHYLVQFGGFNYVNYFNDTWVLDTTAETGTIQVTTNLPNAIFTITGPATHKGTGESFSWINAPPGLYTITYGSVPGRNTPESQTQTLSAGGSVSFFANYSELSGTLTIDSNLAGAVFRIIGPITSSGLGLSQTFSPIPAGQYKVSFQAVPGYITPAAQTLVISNGAAETISGTYRLQAGVGSISVETNVQSASYSITGPATFTGAGSSTYKSVPAGQYTVTFHPLVGPGYITPAAQTQPLFAGQTATFVGRYGTFVIPIKLYPSTEAACPGRTCNTLYLTTHYTSRSASSVTADITVTNSTGTWFEIDLNFLAPSATAPNPVNVSQQQIPYAFLIAPLQSKTFSNIEFSPGTYIEFDATRTSLAAFGTLAIDMIVRGIFSAPLSTSPEDVFNLADAVFSEFLTTLKEGSLGADAVALGMCRDVACVFENVPTVIVDVVSDQNAADEVLALITEVSGPQTAQLWASFVDQNIWKIANTIGEIFALPKKLTLLTELSSDTISAPTSDVVRVEAR